MASYIDDGIEDSLETRLNKATNPLMLEENWEHIVGFCDMVNKDVDGPQMAVRLLVHKIQSPQEKESLFALTTLEACVKNCGARFQQEIGKFRFINELIKVISPKYLGNHMSAKVKNKCILLLYFWSQNLSHEPKIKEAYTMLKRQGIVKEDPDIFQTGVCNVQEIIRPQPSPPTPPPPPKTNSIFEDEDKSKLLSRLLKSKNTEDLQAANRLIKNMVKQDAERVEKVTRRTQQLDTVSNNVKLLNEMLQNYQPGNSTESDREIMKELSENIEKQRPALFKLASDSDEKESSGIGEILKANDDVIQVLSLYDSLINQSDVGNLLAIDDASNGVKKPPAHQTPPPSSHDHHHHQKTHLMLDDHCIGVDETHSLLDEQLLSLGLLGDNIPSSSSSSSSDASSSTTSTTIASTMAKGNNVATTKNVDLSELKDIFTMAAIDRHTSILHGHGTNPTASATIPLQPPPYTPSSSSTTTSTTFMVPNNSNNIIQQLQQHRQQKYFTPNITTTTTFNNNKLIGGLPILPMSNASNVITVDNVAPSKYTNLFDWQATSSSSSSPSATVPSTSTAGSSGGLGSLDALSKSLLQETLTSSGLKPFTPPVNPTKLSLNEMSNKIPPAASTSSSSTSSSSTSSTTLSTPTTISTTTSTSTSTTFSNATQTTPENVAKVVEHSKNVAALKQNGDAKNKVEGISLDDVMVPLESFKPSKKPPIEVYNENNIRITFHFSDHQPKPHVHVVAVTTTSISSSVVKDFCFLATVSKPMRVKVQSAASKEFKAYNPIFPPDIITQLIFIANPLQEPIKLKYKVSYMLDDDDIILDVGEVNDIPLF